MHPTDVRALIALMDAARAGEEMTAGRLGGALGQAFFGPLIGSAVELLQGYDDRELAAIRGFLGGVRAAAAEG